jgi:hypothetical protein
MKFWYSEGKTRSCGKLVEFAGAPREHKTGRCCGMDFKWRNKCETLNGYLLAVNREFPVHC